MGLRATTPDELRAQLKKALAPGEPALIEVPVGPMPSPWGILRFTTPVATRLRSQKQD